MRLGALASPKVGYARAARAKNLATLASCPQHNRRERDASRPERSVGSTDGCCRTRQRGAWDLYNAPCRVPRVRAITELPLRSRTAHAARAAAASRSRRVDSESRVWLPTLTAQRMEMRLATVGSHRAVR